MAVDTVKGESDGKAETMDTEARSKLGDLFDRQMRSFHGLPDVVKTAPTTVRALSKFYEAAQTFIIQTVRQKDEGDTIFLEYIGAEGSLRVCLPPVVAQTLKRHFDALSTKSRSKAGKMRAEADKAAGIEPGFMQKKARNEQKGGAK